MEYRSKENRNTIFFNTDLLLYFTKKIKCFNLSLSPVGNMRLKPPQTVHFLSIVASSSKAVQRCGTYSEKI